MRLQLQLLLAERSPFRATDRTADLTNELARLLRTRLQLLTKPTPCTASLCMGFVGKKLAFDKLQGVLFFFSFLFLMISSILQGVLMPVSFGSLLCLMLLYWGQAALFSYTKYSKLTTGLFYFSFTSITTLLILRWVDSGHFPLSNLYESLLFLAWSFLGIQLAAQFTLITSSSEPVLLRGAESDLPPSDEKGVAPPTTFSFSKFFEEKSDFGSREISQRQLLHLLGVITSPMALLTYGFAFLNLPREMQKATALVPALQSNWLMMHVTIMILSYAALLCGSIFSMVFLLLTSLNTLSPRLQTVSNSGECSLLLSEAEQEQEQGVLPSYAHEPLLLLSEAKPARTEFRYQSSLHSEAVQGRSEGPRPRAKVEIALAPSQGSATLGHTLNKSAPMLSRRLSKGGASTFVKPARFVDKGGEAHRGKTPYLSLAERLDNYSYRVLALGFPLLTVGILSGAVWANEAWGSYWSWDPKETWALITWLVFAIYLHARILKGWTGRKPAIIATFGFFVVWFCYLGVNLLGTGLHSYGWFSK